eukprot:SM000165S02185  [mRNA]  locus=s165:68144:71459:+ [translate_table: standard]
MVDNLRAPAWGDALRIPVAHDTAAVVVSVKEGNTVGAELVGRASVPVAALLPGDALDGWFELVKDGRNANPAAAAAGDGAKLRLSLRFVAATADPAYRAGVPGDGSRFPGIPFTYFPLRTGCRVRLFQDAHVPNGLLPRVHLAGDRVYEPGRCWEETFAAIAGARHLVYVAGWSVNTETTLVRDLERPVPGAVGVTLGELLKRKANEGVAVLVMQWDDRTSSQLLHNATGIMNTHDEETRMYFAGTKVHCFLCPRNPAKNLTISQGAQIGNLFTHHQKMVAVDVPADVSHPLDGRRRIASFVGGIDLCGGRFDTQAHSLFATLSTYHAADYHQACFETAAQELGGPREPWHDIHARVEGPAAWDLLFNFEQRWRKQAGTKLEAELLPIAQVAALDPPTAVMEEADPDTWTVQILRSIDSASVAGFPDMPEDMSAAGLVNSKSDTVDRSIQNGYIHAIRRAQHFIYIENQYFLGSSFAWEADQACGAFNMIPIEIALKIVQKIEAGQHFAAYIVVPMYPDGVPSGGACQAILHWQARTMSMMYRLIAAALRRAGRMNEHPRDYLAFFCLGNRELPVPHEYVAPKTPTEKYYRRAQEHRRFMVYVHAKMMIVDDEFIIVGSANINERSQSGTRDTELAMAAFQPHHTWATGALSSPPPRGGPPGPRGEIHGFRMSLWAEHVGSLDNVFLDPKSLECMRKLQVVGAQNWADFAGEQLVLLKGHLMSYPVVIDQFGGVGPLAGQHYFPDSLAPILGTKSGMLPDILTT